ncbi:NAD(P)/FAD-dependent oxidoreductase [Burkholderia cenocepacia]|uniref:FAD/NAD(P)-dependent oxidoreductase n=1 Tax=Burkholderia cenocepacia TaxID=95486 RepID=UPI00048273A3|nr:(2Fe-2S)-binding protein [Burkholderia cenocepacia]MBR8089982.1 FAD-dependent oxidoreductase [Burkholderia cenocepacia]MBR8511349.1 FAD-dependent oxidoreductase [Burkholderia cenocepacia]MCA8406456.1 FAD-dependent oxidoreductase [Burkholderia cenocepacia]RQV54089.1 FAD-dependent oxidoreductase [Burkholderia cenocepacia]
MTRHQCDLLIVGAGPAGMAAATAARAAGLSVVVADEGRAPGGQIYRNVTDAPAPLAQWLGADYTAGRPLVDGLLASGAHYLPRSVVWQVAFEPAPVAMLTQGGPARGTLEIGARAVLIATGAQERPWPVPGWTLPGVMGVGAAQTLLKASGLAPSADAVLAGSGPLLWLFAAQLLNAGRRVRALVDTTPRDAWRRALPHALPALRGADYLLKGWRMLRAVRRAGIPVYRGATNVRIDGESRAERIRFRDEDGVVQTLDTSLVLLHQGVIPSTQLARSLGCAHEWDESSACWRPRCDARGRSSVPHVWIAGDGAGIGGARAAALAGEVSALDIATQLGALDMQRQAARERPVLRALRRHLTVRPLLDALYTPPAALRRPDDDTIVCRCEEVTAGEIRRLAALGCQGPNQMKAFTRCGMGPCQGRWCGTTVGELIADVQQRGVGDVGHYRIRAPIKPVTVGEMADALELSNDFQRGEFPS